MLRNLLIVSLCLVSALAQASATHDIIQHEGQRDIPEKFEFWSLLPPELKCHIAACADADSISALLFLDRQTRAELLENFGYITRLKYGCNMLKTFQAVGNMLSTKEGVDADYIKKFMFYHLGQRHDGVDMTIYIRFLEDVRRIAMGAEPATVLDVLGCAWVSRAFYNEDIEVQLRLSLNSSISININY